ncbi:MAG: hypothetical protein JSV39_02800 [Candidatus Aenigmatarchaeota archaeon]|nr:MAG: hypothetical protein JSV39_02800 [Candidatus Aenigmarchaeota archaeon]
MPFGKYNDNKDFMYGFNLPYSSKIKKFDTLLLKIGKRYEVEGGGISDNGRDAVIGAVASLFLQGLDLAANALIQETGVKIDRETKKTLNYASLASEIIMSASYQIEEKEESFTDKFLKEMGIKPTN